METDNDSYFVYFYVFSASGANSEKNQTRPRHLQLEALESCMQFYGQELQDRALVKFVYEVSKTSTEISLFKTYKWHLSQ